MDPHEYLSDEFDVSKLTIPNLRSILVEHEINFPSNANKSHLIHIFNTEIKPNSSKILEKYNVIPSIDGILDISREKNDNKINKIIEPLKISADDKIIPSKRQINSIETPKRTKRKTRKVIKSNDLSDSNSSFGSPSNSFLSIEKFEINENDDIFNGPIDNTPIDLLKKTKYSNKKTQTPTKDILSNFDKSVPASKIFESEKKIVLDSQIENIGNDDINLKSTDNIKNNDENILQNNIIDIDIDIDDDNDNDNGNENLNNNSLLDDIFNSNNHELQGPTKNIKELPDSIITVASSDGEEVEKIIDIVDEKFNSTINVDVKSLSSFESDEISISYDSINNDNNMNINIKLDENIEKSELNEEKNEEILNDNEVNIEIKGNYNLFSIIFLNCFSLINILIPIILLSCFREIKYNTGYCGFEQPNKLLNIWDKIPNNYNETLLPIKPYIEIFENFLSNSVVFECKKCPENGICDLNNLECDYNYIKTFPIKSVFGIIPLEETCEFDHLREKKMFYLTKYTLNYLRHHNQQKLTLDELHDYLISTKPSNMNVKEFEEYWDNFVKYEITKDAELDFNFNTKEITLSHKTPTEYYTRTFGNIQNAKKSKNLFKRTPPTVDLKGYYTNPS